MSDWLRTAPVTELVKERTTFLRGTLAVKYSTKKERAFWALMVERITEELTRRNEAGL
jgi:hypothetical protein